MLSLGIIWNPAFKYRDEIILDMSNRVNVIGYFDMDLKGLFKEFIYELYNDEEQRKTDKKYNSMKVENNISNQIRIVFFEFDERKVEFHPHKKKIVYSNLNDLKVYIRNMYSQKISNYVFDNIFHSTDDLAELKTAYKIVQKYLNLLLIDDLKRIIEKRKITYHAR